MPRRKKKQELENDVVELKTKIQHLEDLLREARLEIRGRTTTNNPDPTDTSSAIREDGTQTTNGVQTGNVTTDLPSTPLEARHSPSLQTQTDHDETRVRQAKSKIAKSPFDKIHDDDDDVAGKMILVATEVKQFLQTHDETDLLIALRKAIPYFVRKSIDPNSSMSLPHLIQAIEKRYNSTACIQEELNKVYSFQLETTKSKTNSVMDIVDRVTVFNACCTESSSTRRGKMWSIDRILFYICDTLFQPYPELAKAFYAEWQLKAKTSDVETWDNFDIREILSEAEDKFDFHQQQNKSHMSTLLTRAADSTSPIQRDPKSKRNCWTCAAVTTLTNGKFIHTCPTPQQTCSNCRGNHLSQFHDEVPRINSIVNRRNNRNSAAVSGIGTSVGPSCPPPTQGNVQALFRDIKVREPLACKFIAVKARLANIEFLAILDTAAQFSSIRHSLLQRTQLLHSNIPQFPVDVVWRLTINASRHFLA